MKKNAQIQAVIFDVGAVLVELDFNRPVRAVAQRLKLTPDEVHARIFGGGDYYGPQGPRLLLDYECGRVSDAEFHRHVEAWLGRPLPFPAFCRLWNAIFVKPIATNVRLLRTLQRRGDLKVGILSNANALHCRYLRRRMRVLNEIEYVYFSQEIGCRKPDPAAFRYALNGMAVKPARTVFIDDNAENIAAARKLGLLGIHATHVEAVRDGLGALGLLKT